MKVVILISLCFYCFVSTEIIEEQSENALETNHTSIENRPRLFENKDLVDLLRMSHKGKILASLAAKSFQRMFGSKTIAPFSMDTIIIHETAEIFQAENLVSALFQIFGQHIQKLELDYNQLHDGERKEIHKLMRKYCGDSLKSLHLVRWDSKILQSLNILDNVENLTLSGNEKISRGYFNMDFLYTKKKLNETFPKLRQLTLDYVIETDSVFDIEFPQLEQVKITSSWPKMDEEYLPNTKQALKSLFLKNSQILNLIYVHCNSLDMLEIASNHLPNLKTLQVNVFELEDEYNGEIIRFANVKNAYLWWQPEIKLSHFLSFDQLEELYMTCSADECVSFIEQNKNVRKIYIAGDLLKNEHILEIGEEIKQLEELFIATTAEIDTYTITEYYKINEKLRKFRLEIIDSLFLYSRMEKETPGFE